MMQHSVIIYVVAATVISLLIAILLLILLIQRHRQRAMLLQSLSLDESNRRRRKQKKGGLRRWEIDLISPEALVARISDSVKTPTLHSQTDHPHQYNTALATLRSANLLPITTLVTSPSDINEKAVVFPITPPPPVAQVEDITGDALESFSDPVPLRTAIPCHVAVLPTSHQICVICLDDVALAQRVRILPCTHIYHSQCIRTWLRRKNSCPSCAEKVSKRPSSHRHARATATSSTGRTVTMARGSSRERQPSHIPFPITESRTTTISSIHSRVTSLSQREYDDGHTDDESFTFSNHTQRDRSSLSMRQKPPFPSLRYPPSPSAADGCVEVGGRRESDACGMVHEEQPTPADLLFEEESSGGLNPDNNVVSFSTSVADLSDAVLCQYPNLGTAPASPAPDVTGIDLSTAPSLPPSPPPLSPSSSCSSLPV